jgi:hypothetical protein
MDQVRRDTDKALDLFLELLPEVEACSLPMPRFGKTPPSAQQTQSLPAAGGSANGDAAFSLSWVDEEELGIRVFVTAERGSGGVEIVAFVEGVRPDLLGQAVHVSLWSDEKRTSAGLTVSLDQPAEGQRGCTGRKSFGSVDELRRRLGDKVCLDLFLVEYPHRSTPT